MHKWYPPKFQLFAFLFGLYLYSGLNSLLENNAKWFGEICVCSCLTVVPGPAWVLLNYLLQTFFFSTLYFVSLWGTALPLSSAYVIYGGSLIHIMWQPNLAIHPPMNALKYSAMLLFLPLQLLCPILAMMMTMPVQSRRVGDTLVKCWLTVRLSFALKLDDKKTRVLNGSPHQIVAWQNHFWSLNARDILWSSRTVGTKSWLSPEWRGPRNPVFATYGESPSPPWSLLLKIFVIRRNALCISFGGATN